MNKALIILLVIVVAVIILTWGSIGSAALTLGLLLGGIFIALKKSLNRDHHVWDYRSVPGNYRGQICPVFSLLWIPVSAVGMGLYGLLQKEWDCCSATVPEETE